MALSGMTGFARTEGASGGWTWAVEARSVNGRGLEVRYRGPTGFEGLERSAREAAGARFSRGQINVALLAKRVESSGRLKINVEELDRLIQTARTYVARGGVAEPRFDGLLSLRGVVEVGEEDEASDASAAVRSAMEASVVAALDELLACRRDEGVALTPVLNGLVNGVADLITAAERDGAAQPLILKERFERRMAELLADRSGLEDRIVQEAALMATKADIREELDRLGVHVKAARALLSSTEAVGRKLDFLTQEFMREANTLCAKSAVSALTAKGLDLKAVIEQFREQVQNVE